MTYTKIVFQSILLSALLSYGNVFSQIKFRELPETNSSVYINNLLASSATRQYIPLTDLWQVYKKGDDEKRTASVLVPSVYDGKVPMVYEKDFTLPAERKIVLLNFGGVFPAADIFVNGNLVYRHFGGELPFSVEVARDFQKPGGKNKLTVELILENESPFLMLQKRVYLGPELFPGIIREVNVELLPAVSFAVTDISTNRDSRTGATTLRASVKVSNKDFSSAPEGAQGLLTASLVLTAADGKEYSSTLTGIEVKRGKERDLTFDISIDADHLWTPENPQQMKAKFTLENQGVKIDEQLLTVSPVVFSAGKEAMYLNGLPFLLRGVTYVPTLYNYGHMITYDRMRKDLAMIKDLGFNTVRFSKMLPHPYALRVCEELGLLAFIDASLQNIPKGMLGDAEFKEAAVHYYSSIVRAYKLYQASVAIGLGSSFNASLEETSAFLQAAASQVRKFSGRSVYASFGSGTLSGNFNLDFCGLEFINQIDSARLQDASVLLGKGRVIVSDLGYFAYRGSASGKQVKHSLEAQAGFIDSFLVHTEGIQYSGYCIATMFDYRSAVNAINAGYSNEKTVTLGIVAEDRQLNGRERPIYKVLNAIFHDQERVSISPGNPETESVAVFILYGLVLALFSGLLVKSGKRFREDSMRALTRPYNFFQDVRDQRLYSIMQSVMLGFIASGVYAILVSSVLFSYRNNSAFDFAAQTLGSHSLLGLLSMLVWKPLYSVLFLTAVFFISACIVTVAVRIGGMFVQTRVFFSSCFHITVWSSLPVLLLIPFAILLDKILAQPGLPVFVILFLILVLIFLFFRLMKGMFVIYDVVPGKVYFYSVSVLLVIIGITSLILQVRYNTFDFLFTVLKGI